MVIDRFQKECYSDSTLYPEDDKIMDCVMLYYNIPKGGPHDLYDLCHQLTKELYYHKRERRNRLSPLVKMGYDYFVQANPTFLIAENGTPNQKHVRCTIQTKVDCFRSHEHQLAPQQRWKSVQSPRCPSSAETSIYREKQIHNVTGLLCGCGGGLLF